VEVPGTTVNRFCGSGLQAVNFGAQAVLAGSAQLVVAGGVEHMTRVPMGSDAMGGEGPASPGLLEKWPGLVPQGLSAEMIAEKWGYSRRQLDEFAVGSQQKAANAIEKGYFAREIVPLDIGGRAFARDEHPRPGTTLEALAMAELTVGDIDIFEINEAFAPVPLVVAQELGIPMEKVNPNGGAIALGHPLGATGAMLLGTALHELERRGERRALITLCIGYGMGIATIIDRKVD